MTTVGAVGRGAQGRHGWQEQGIGLLTWVYMCPLCPLLLKVTDLHGGRLGLFVTSSSVTS